MTSWRAPGTPNLSEEVTPENLERWRRERRGPMASFGAEAGGFARSSSDRPAPDLQFGALPGPPTHDLTDSWLPVGSMTPLHLHTRYEERIWVASGSLTVWTGPDKVVLRSGDYHRIPMHVPHTIQSGPEDTHALHISTPAGFAELVVTTELGDVVLGPPGTMPADLDDDKGA
jgi:mannose-6-phosphate isomerase-like protein (cupin superfamily)